MHWKILALLMIISITGITMADTIVDNLIDNYQQMDNIVNPTIYKPCINCYGPQPTPLPYETVGITFTVNPTNARIGQSITLAGSQTSGTTLNSATKWQYTAQCTGDFQVINGQIGTFKPRKAGTYWISLTARDETQRLNGYYKIGNALTSR